MWSIVRGKEYLQADLRAAKAASRDLDEKGLRRWARERIGGLADAMAGRRNEHVRRVLGTYIDEIVVHPTTKTGVMRVNAGLAALVAAGRFGVDDPALRAVRTNGRPRDANGRQRGVNGRPRNANDRPAVTGRIKTSHRWALQNQPVSLTLYHCVSSLQVACEAARVFRR
ncbi:MAG: hypothetical protein EDS66_17805 [Planctomycetota bacterium]|nr:MAG: hypothetical protein EDS66_17805 [Planctomycetota bacterium]